MAHIGCSIQVGEVIDQASNGLSWLNQRVRWLGRGSIHVSLQPPVSVAVRCDQEDQTQTVLVDQTSTSHHTSVITCIFRVA